MIEMIQTFLLKVKECDHVLQLIKNTDLLMVSFICDQQTIPFYVKKGEISLLHRTEEKFIPCEIKGDFAAIEQLLAGKEKLRLLIRRGQLKVSAPFRTVLLLESLFYLPKVVPYKII